MRYALCLTLIGLVASAAQAGDCCRSCGRKYKKVCRVVCDTETVTRIEWGCRCEDVCLPGPPKKVCCRSGCTGGCDSCGGRKVLVPTCGKVRTRKRLIRYEVEEEVPVYRCIVEYVPVCDCRDACIPGCAPAAGPGGPPAPPAAPPEEPLPALPEI